MKQFRLVCFDMWDTLCHGGGRKQILAVRAALHANNITYEPFLQQIEQSLMTKAWSLEQGITDLVMKLKLPKKEKLIKKVTDVWINYIQSLQPFPETMAVLKKLKQAGIKLALVSNTDVTSIKIKIPELGWDKYLDMLFLSAEIGVLKPNRKIFQTIENYFKSPKNQVLFVDDSLYYGIYPARKFGWQALWINRGKPGEDKNEINDLNGVFKYVINK